MVVRAEDLVSGKILCQLRLVSPEVVRAALRTLVKVEAREAATLTNLLLSQGALDRSSRARVQKYTKLYQGARTAALETALLKSQKLIPDSVVDRALAEAEAGGFEQRVGEILVASGELGRLQDQRLVEGVSKTLSTEDAKLVTSYAGSDWEGVARSLTKDRGADLDTGQFTVKKLFRSKESQRLARLSALAAKNDDVPAPPPRPTAKPTPRTELPPTAKLATSSATPLPPDRTPPPPYAQASEPGELTFGDKAALDRFSVPPPAPPPPAPAPTKGAGDPFGENTGELNFNRVGPYLILRKLAMGSLGPTYLARRPDLAKPVALKVALMEKREVALPQFRKAAEIGRLIRNEGLVNVVDQGEHDGLPLLALEYIPGDTVRTLLDREGPQSEARVLLIASDLLGALVAIHATGLLHNDIASDSVLVNVQAGKPRAKLPDLGRSIRSGDTPGALSEEQTLYAAPEALARERLDARADLYAVGVVLFEALTQQLPFARGTRDEVRERKLSLAAKTLGQARPDRPCSPALEELVARLLARDRAQRPPSAARALKAIGEIVLPGLERNTDTARLGTRFDALFRE